MLRQPRDRPASAFRRSRASTALTTADGIPYSKIATLHGRDVLATTVLQTCIRYESRTKSCQFCAIGQSLAAGRTIAHKTPAAARRGRERRRRARRRQAHGDDHRHAATPATAARRPVRQRARDQGRRRPADPGAVRAAGRRSLVRAHARTPASTRWACIWRSVTPELRGADHAGQGEVPVERYMSAFEAAVPVFGRGQVSTYILAGLGDTREAILGICERLIALGVYPFVVPFVPISRHAARRPSRRRARSSWHRCSGRSAQMVARRAALRPTSRPAAASAAPARRSRSTKSWRARSCRRIGAGAA